MERLLYDPIKYFEQFDNTGGGQCCRMNKSITGTAYSSIEGCHVTISYVGYYEESVQYGGLLLVYLKVVETGTEGDDAMQDREWQLNSAALAIHKSIIGIVKLEELEDVASDNLLSGFLYARAIYTYYCVYHLFVACMLMDYENTKGL